MIWDLKNLQVSKNGDFTERNGVWIPARPENWKHRTFFEKVKESWAVFTGKAEAFKWPGNQ